MISSLHDLRLLVIADDPLARAGLAAALRFHRLGAQSFWNDEGNSARLSERSLAAILEGTASDIHPPLYFWLLHLWNAVAGMAPTSAPALLAFTGRFLSVAAGVLGGSADPRVEEGVAPDLGHQVGEGADLAHAVGFADHRRHRQSGVRWSSATENRASASRSICTLASTIFFCKYFVNRWVTFHSPSNS